MALVAAASAPTGLGTLAAILAAIVVLWGTLAGGGLGLKGYRALYGYGMRRGRKALAGSSVRLPVEPRVAGGSPRRTRASRR